MFHDPHDYPFAARFEAAWPEIRTELDGLAAADFFDWYEPDAHEGKWQIAGLHSVNHPEAHRLDPEVARRCPRAIEIAKEIEGLHFVAFSLLGPKAVIHPHTDVGPRALRLHLGVRVPRNCVFQVGEERQEWKEGRCLIFDGSVLHAAWNNSTKPRIVLVAEFAHPGG